MHKLLIIFVISLSFILPRNSFADNHLKNVQKIITGALEANNIKMRVNSENMANSKSANYIPKTAHLRAERAKNKQYSNVRVKRINRNKNKVRKEYQPGHPQADENGYVNMPDVDPMIALLDLQQTKLEAQRLTKAYEAATDIRHKTINLINIQ